jgi:acylphosphatase
VAGVSIPAKGRNDTVQWTRIRARCVGHVQGVSFRANAQSNATSLGLSGWVRNEPDGTVTLEIEGPKPKVEALVDWCRQGPPGARVDDVVVLTLSPTYDRSPFAIKA